MLFTTVDALELIVRLKRRSDLAYFEVKYLLRQIQRYFIFWDPRSNDPANNRAQNQAAIYQDLAQGYRQVTLENATLRMDFIGQDSDLLYAFITDYQQDFMEFVKANRAQRS